MKLPRDELRDALCAECAIGLLRGAARRRFVKMVDRDPDLLQTRQHAAHPPVAIPVVEIDLGGQGRGVRPDEVPEDVDQPPFVGGGELHSLDELDPQAGALLPRLGQSRHRVVVGQSDHLEARRPGPLDHPAGRIAAIRRIGVEVQVHHAGGLGDGTWKRLRHPSPWRKGPHRAGLPSAIRGRADFKVERAMGLEPTTSSLGSWHSTAELRPRSATENRRSPGQCQQTAPCL